LVFFANQSFNNLGQKARELVRAYVYDNSLNHYAVLANCQTGELTNKLFSDAGDLGERLGQRVVLILVGVLQSLVVLTLIYYFSWVVGLIVTCIYPVYFLICSIINKKIRKHILDIRKNQALAEHTMLKGIQGWMELAVLQKQKYYANIYRDKLEIITKSFNKYNKFNALNLMLQDFVCSSLPIIAVILCTIPYLVTSSNSSILIIYILAGYLMQPLHSLSEIFQMWHEDNALKERLKDVLFFKEEDYGKDTIQNISSVSINIDSYSYDDLIVFNNCNFKFKKGDFVLIRGESGCGKTTLLKLLIKQASYENLKGNIYFNNTNIIDLKRNELYNKLQYVGQKYFIFEDTLYNNLCMGDKFSQIEIDEVIDICCLKDFVNQYGYNLFIEENGKNISQGQLQRICIARSLLRRPQCLLLDEPTSALDKVNAQSLIKNISSYTKKNNIITLLISHDNESYDFVDYCINL